VAGAGGGGGARGGAGPSPLITVHPPTKLNFASPGKPGASQYIYIYIKGYRTHPGGQKMLFTQDGIGKVRYVWD